MLNMYVPIYSPALTVTLMFYSETQAVQTEYVAHQSKYVIILVHQHCCLPGEQAYSLKITYDNDLYYGTRDRSVSLNCEFTLDSEDLENLDIEWNIVPPNRQEDEILILSYTQSII